FIEIKIKNLNDLKAMSGKCDDMCLTAGDKPKRKRERLDHLSNDEKIKRRKLHNRAAAQLARDRKKVKMSELQDTVHMINKQKRLLECSNEALITRCKALERENCELKRRLSEVPTQAVVSVEGSDRIVESAELINVSQPQRHETIATETTPKPVSHSTTPFIYWLAVLNLIQCLNSSNNALKNCSTQRLSPQTTPTTVRQSADQLSSADGSLPTRPTLTLLNT
ncbi:unnamed protein product, partial [Medioppia subpectinata]